jgi:hypothetical protein
MGKKKKGGADDDVGEKKAWEVDVRAQRYIRTPTPDLVDVSGVPCPRPLLCPSPPSASVTVGFYFYFCPRVSHIAVMTIVS